MGSFSTYAIVSERATFGCDGYFQKNVTCYFVINGKKYAVPRN